MKASRRIAALSFALSVCVLPVFADVMLAPVAIGLFVLLPALGLALFALALGILLRVVAKQRNKRMEGRRSGPAAPDGVEEDVEDAAEEEEGE